MPDTVVDTGDTMIVKTEKIPVLKQLNCDRGNRQRNCEKKKKKKKKPVSDCDWCSDDNTSHAIEDAIDWMLRKDI